MMQQIQNAQESMLVPKPYKVLEFTRESPDNFTLKVDMKATYMPGQFVQVSIPGVGEAPISFSSYSKDYIKMTIRQVGNVTNALSKLRKGNTVFIRGPYGNGYPLEKLKGNNIIIIGGGCGVSPIKGVMEYLEVNRKDFRDVILFLGYRSPDDVLFRKELAKWRQKYHITVTVDQNPKDASCFDAKVGFITNALRESDLNNENKVVFICGPPLMMKYSIEILKQKGFHDDQIFVSNERLMYCALGACCHCMIRDKFTCLDGPVFRYDEISGYKND